MSEKTVFAVPKDRQQVRVRLAKDSVIEGEIFLESVSEGLSSHQKVTSFLENENLFFPLKASPSGTTEFIHKTTIQSVDVVLPDEPESDYFSGLHLHTLPVIVYFPDGESISGQLMAEVPQEKTRLSDCLNLRATFLSVRSENTVYYINKSSLRKVVHA